MIKTKNILDNYILENLIGKGSYASVQTAIHKKLKKKVAIKIISKTSKNYPKNKEAFKNEIIIFRKLLHENLIQLYEIFEDEKNLYLIMEFAKDGDFLDILLIKKKLSEREALFYFRQIINGIQYLHFNGIAHLDIKLENILLINHCVKITDFGFSCFLPNGFFLNKFCGTLRYTAPEILRNIPYSGELADIWSVGVVLYILVCGFCPFESDTAFQILKKARKKDLSFPDYLSKEIIDLICKMIEPDVNKRISINEITKHKWFLQNDIISMIYIEIKNTKINQFRLTPKKINSEIFGELIKNNYDFGNHRNYENRIRYIKKGKTSNWVTGYRILYSFSNFMHKTGGNTHPFLIKEFCRKKNYKFNLKEIEDFYNYFFINMNSDFFWKFGYETNFSLKNLFRFLVDSFNFFKIKIYCIDKNQFFYKCLKKEKNKSSQIFFFRLFTDYDSIVIDIQNFNMNQIQFCCLIYKINKKIDKRFRDFTL